MLRTRTTALVTVAVSLALPGAALAQSAGDNQYQDPLAGQSSQHHHSSSSSSGTSGSSSQGSGTSGSTTSSSSSGSSGSTASSPSANAAASGRQLPRTGFELLLPLELGLALLLAGVTLRRVVTLRDRA